MSLAGVQGRSLWIRSRTAALRRAERFSPYQLVLGTLTLMYALRHLDVLFGVGPPEPLARLVNYVPILDVVSAKACGMADAQQYSRSYYRATWVNTAFDAGFASAMTIRPKWLKDAMSFIFAVYYMVYHNEGDEVVSAVHWLSSRCCRQLTIHSCVVSGGFAQWRCCGLPGRRPITLTSAL